MNGKVRLVALVVFGLLVIGGAAVFAERQHTATSREQRPDVNILLAGAVERNAGRVNLDRAGQLTPGEVIDWTINSRNQGAAAARPTVCGFMRATPSTANILEWRSLIRVEYNALSELRDDNQKETTYEPSAIQERTVP